MRHKVTFTIDQVAEKDRHMFWDTEGKKFDPLENTEREISFRRVTTIILHSIKGEGLDAWCELAGINPRRSRTAQDQWTVSRNDIKRLNRLGVRFRHEQKS